MPTGDATRIQSLIELSRSAGEAIMAVYNSDFTVEQKADKSPLTAADKNSHDLIASYLGAHFSYPVLSEEGKGIPYEDRKNWGQFWLVDPLDGTKEFVKKAGDFTVNIALIRNGEPVLGVIYLPVTGSVYYAEKGAGAFRVEQGKTERLPLPEHKNSLTVVGSRSHATKELEHYIEMMTKKYGEIEVVSRGSSLKFCLVAEGRAEVYPRIGPTMEWDTAAGQIIVEEAGGRVLEFESRRPLRYNKVSLLNPNFLALRGNRYV